MHLFDRSSSIMSQLWLILLIISSSQCTQLYVVPFPTLSNDHISDGSREYPYSSLQQALDHVKLNYHQSRSRTTINLYPTYHFVKTIYISQLHSHIHLTTMNDSDAHFYKDFVGSEGVHRRLTSAVISGGIPVTNWIATGNNVYKTIINQPIFVNQLFINNQRIVRTRVPTNHSDFLQFAAPLSNPSDARYGFQYYPGQFNYTSLEDIMVIVYCSWAESHHYIDRLIPTNNTIRFSNPSNRPIGTFPTQSQHRFHIENVCEALVPNSFCFLNQTKTIYLMTDGSYDPNQSEIITSVYEFILIIASDNITNPVENILIDNVIIQHSAWNMNRTQQVDASMAAHLTYAALYIENASSIMISNVEISHTGSYGIFIRPGSTNVNIINSLISDMGAGGIAIGQNVSSHEISPSSIKILSNEICYGGNVFLNGVGVFVAAAEDVIVADNVIHHLRYNGISAGTTIQYFPTRTINVLIQGNYVYNIGQHILCDQGGIYTFGVQPTTIIHGNVVKNVFSYATFMWGIYLDEGSSDILVSNNIVYNTGWASLFQHYGANNTIVNNVFARASLIQRPQSIDPLPDGDLHIQEAENHTSWIFTRNIIYDTFQGTNHSAYTSNPYVIASFSKNIYYNPYNTTLLFGSKQMSFDEWQKLGQDNESMIADPLFIGDVNQCDFFTIRQDSPAAKLGFVNLTKLPKWTSGCDTVIDNQFYHW